MSTWQATCGLSLLGNFAAAALACSDRQVVAAQNRICETPLVHLDVRSRAGWH